MQAKYEIKQVDGATWMLLPKMSVERSAGVFERLAGKCNDNWRNSDANAMNFPIPEDGKVEEFEGVLVHFGCVMSDEAVFAHAIEHDLLDPNPEHTLTVCSEMPELQKEFPVVANAHKDSRSIHVDRNGRHRVLVLSGSGELRLLNVDFFDGGWATHCRFLFIRKMC